MIFRAKNFWMMNSGWTFNGQNFDESMIGDNVGFIYLITNLDNGRKYIGQKGFWSKKIKVTKGIKKRIKVQSDWMDYYGSCQELLNDIQSLGKEKFKREILSLHKAKGVLNYVESKMQFELGVLESDDYYNRIINCRVNQSHLKTLL